MECTNVECALAQNMLGRTLLCTLTVLSQKIAQREGSLWRHVADHKTLQAVALRASDGLVPLDKF